MFSTSPFVKFYPSITSCVNVLYYKRVNQFCGKFAQMLLGARAWNAQLWGSRGWRSSSQAAKVRFGGIVLDSCGQVAFLL